MGFLSIVPLTLTASLQIASLSTFVELHDSYFLIRVPSALIAQSESTIGGDGGNSFSWNSLRLFIVNASDAPQTVIIGNHGREHTIAVGPWEYRDFSPLYRNISELENQSISWNGKASYFWNIRTNDRRGGKYDGGYVVGIGSLGRAAMPTPQETIANLRSRQQEKQLQDSRQAEEVRLQEEAERRRAALQAEQKAQQERAIQLEAARRQREADQRRAAKLEAKRLAKEQRDREKAIIMDSGAKPLNL